MDSLLLLHGALGSKDQFDSLIPKLEEHYEIHTLNFEGHGQAGPTDSAFRIEYFSENVLGYLDEHDIREINIFGYSMGGYVALNLAKEQPESVHKIATLGTILQWDEEIAELESRHLYPDRIKEKVPLFADQLKQRHLYGCKKVVDKTRELVQNLGSDPVIKKDDWQTIKHSIRLHVGDRDTTAGIDKTIEIYRKMDYADLAVLPKTGHSLLEVNQSVLIASLVDFFKDKKQFGQDDHGQKKMVTEEREVINVSSM